MRESESVRRKRRGSLMLGLSSNADNLLYLRESLPDRYECVCRFCQAQSDKTLLKQWKVDPTDCKELTSKPSIKKLEGQNCYAFILDRLLEVGSYKTRGLAVCLPDTVLFDNGGPKCIVITNSSRDENLKIIKQKEKLTYLQLRKFLDERRKKYNNQVRMRALELTSFTLLTKEMTISINNPQVLSRRFVLKQSSTIKESSVIRSKLDNYMSVRTHTNRGSDHQQPETEELNRTKKQKELCLISYRDNTTQIIGPQEYAFLFERRKIDPYWHTVSSIQNVVKPVGSYLYKEVRYRNCRIFDPQLYERARREVAIVIQNYAREEFVSNQQEDQFRMELRSSSEPRYLLYTAYKLVHFLESQGVTIYHCNFYFLKDVFGTIYFMDSNGVYYSRRQLTMIASEVNHQQSQQLLVEQNKRKEHTEDERNIVRKICVDMLANALEMRKIQLKLDSYENPPRTTVERIFRLFHPDFENNLNKIINSVNWKRDVEEEIDRIRQRTHYLIHNSQGLKVLHLHGIYFSKTLVNAKPQIRSQSAQLSERRMSLPLFSNNFKPWRNSKQPDR